MFIMDNYMKADILAEKAKFLYFQLEYFPVYCIIIIRRD